MHGRQQRDFGGDPDHGQDPGILTDFFYHCGQLGILRDHAAALAAVYSLRMV